MKVLLTSAGLETEEIKKYFVELADADMASAKALFIPVAAVNADAITVLPKCMNDLLKCGIQDKNISVYDLHRGMDTEELQQYDIVYLCGGDTGYLLHRINETGFNKTLLEYIDADGVVLGVSAGSLIFFNNIPGNLGLFNVRLDVHCKEGEPRGKLTFPLKNHLRLTDACALAVRNIPDGLEIIGGEAPGALPNRF